MGHVMSFVVFEGIDGSGTTTMANRLAEYLKNSTFHCEPTDAYIGRFIRSVLRKEMSMGNVELGLLFVADRIQHSRQIAEELTAKKTVVCDRYSGSTYAYQNRSFPLKFLQEVCFQPPFVIKPDLVIYLDVSIETSEARRAQRSGNPERFEDRETQQMVAEAYIRFLEDAPTFGWNVRVVDANQDIETVWTEIRKLFWLH